MRKLITLITFLTLSLPSHADVLVKTKESGIGLGEIKISLVWAKLTDLSSPQQYMMINLQEQQSYMVDQNQKIMVKMDGMEMLGSLLGGKFNSDNAPTVNLKNAGVGPRIAGFRTQKYLLTANDQLCSVHFISKEALKVRELKSFAQSVEKLAQSPQYLTEHNTPCEFAELKFEKMAFVNGIPLMSKNAAGKETYRVLEIDKKINFSMTEVAPPMGYKRVSPQQMMHRQRPKADAQLF